MKNTFRLYIALLISAIFSCQKNYEETKVDLSSYHLAEDFRLEAIAAEPLIEAPVAMDFDEKGRPWVLELPGYMSNLDGEGENAPIGRIVILEDRDGDGQMDHAIPFLEGLKAARAFAHAYGGILYAEPPNLWWVKNNGDAPGKKILVDSTYVIGGNIEHQPNGLLRNIDNWWYSAKSSFRYRKTNEGWIKEPTSFRGQWGITKDDFGRLFYNDNSNPLYGDYILPNLFLKNKHHQPTEGISEIIAPDRRVYPLHATAVNRGYIDGTLDEENKLLNYTSACGPVIYQGDNLGEEFQGNAFVCGPEANLIKRYILHQEGNIITAENAYSEKEFLASTDEAFRPVNLYNSPDGSLYVVDFHRGVIQHKVYMTAYLREQLIEKGLDSIVHFGRILKIVSKNKPVEKSQDLSKLSPEELTQLLSSENGWARSKAQQIIIEKNIREAIPILEKIITDHQNPLAKIHALWSLEGLDALDSETLKNAAFKNNSEVTSTALHLLNLKFPEHDNFNLLEEKIKGNDDVLDLQLCLSAGLSQKTFPILTQLLNQHESDTLFYDAALSGLNGNEFLFDEYLKKNATTDVAEDFKNILTETIKNKKTGIVFHQGTKTETHTDQKTVGLDLYRTHCASCHGINGKGMPNLAPPISHSEYIEGDPSLMISIALHGMKGPVTIGGKKYEMNAVMPGLAVNPEMTDEKIAAILTFIRHGFGRKPLDISAEDVATLREVLPRDGMFTEGELLER